MAKYLMALDAGTTSNRCILFNRDRTIASVAQKEFQHNYPAPGWVEQDPMAIWTSMCDVIRAAMKDIDAKAEDVAAIGITNQRETTILWDRSTGEPVYSAIGWECRRTASMCDRLREEGKDVLFRVRTGLILDAYFSATKIRWILDHVDGARERAERGELAFGTVDSWLVWNLTGGKKHVTDVSNASRTMLFNIHTLAWDEEIARELEIPMSLLPTVRSNSEIYGYTDPELFGGEIAIAGMAGDQQSSLFGQTCFEKGEAKNTYGTGCFLLMNTGEEAVVSANNLLTTIAWQINGVTTYALEGSVFTGGSVVQWLRDELGIIWETKESETLARQVEDTNGCYFVPAFNGLGAPYWDSYASGMIIGLSRGVTRAHIARAALEAIAFQVDEVLSAMQEDGGADLSTLFVDGGATTNDLLMQMQSDITDIEVVRSGCMEATAMGAAYLAGLAVGFWTSMKELKEPIKGSKVFTPSMGKEDREKKRRRWKAAVTRCRDWNREID